jgi:ribosome-associated heat shock protein Hsp15
VLVNGRPAKPARSARVGDVINAVTGPITRTVRVMALLEQRVGAALVKDYLEDLTPASEYEKPREPDFAPGGFRPKGSGRPTKRDRRRIEGFFG